MLGQRERDLGDHKPLVEKVDPSQLNHAGQHHRNVVGEHASHHVWVEGLVQHGHRVLLGLVLIFFEKLDEEGFSCTVGDVGEQTLAQEGLFTHCKKVSNWKSTILT